jgi:hypothetical protein
VTKIAAAKLRKYKSPGSDQILAELIQTGSETFLRYLNSLILFTTRKNRSTNVPMHKIDNKTD